MGDIGLRLVVVVVGDEVLHRVVGEKLLELLAQLGGQDLVVGQHQGGALDGLDDLGHGVGLARAGDAQKDLLPQAVLNAPVSATASLLERRDVIVVSSVSCIYGLGEPDDFEKMMISLRVGANMERDELLRRLVDIRYERNDIAFERNMFRVRGDTVELWPAYWKDSAIRVEFFGDEIDRVSEINPVTGAVTRRLTNIPVWPASHYVTSKDKMERAIGEIQQELEERDRWFTEQGKLVEAQRIRQRTTYDLEMMREDEIVNLSGHRPHFHPGVQQARGPDDQLHDLVRLAPLVVRRGGGDKDRLMEPGLELVEFQGRSTPAAPGTSGCW